MRLPALLVALLLGACDDYVIDSKPASPVDIDAVLALDGDVTSGEAVFQEHCRVCHDVAGNDKPGKPGPGLAPWVENATEAETIQVIVEGREPLMPKLLVDDEQQLADLLAWMAQAWSTPEG
ncbi:MAG: cytochrome c [Alphaproteobacteria bacterium]|nr:cytochrome c [Alphaproteobacteria bacterium]